ncbi:response regulator [Legionella londiniensis]|uniref:Sensory box histidine kinase/response regulator n=2 Tax=Legionella londiniensis TaxID=45068 RepID=A0A0W0VIJ8_9GAMM|nr:response regulator [Legionella londiniensis]KTD19919.1 sensory box histidine kinase/response regulator [Legionella londiniensis]STX94208.1 sensory box histidine kinase/response regulator [Legionella londiniensis]
MQRKSHYPHLRILIVEDNTVLQKVARQLFKNIGIKEENIQYAANGHEALEIIKHNKPFNIIYMDHEMPGMQGDQATKLIREYEELNRSQKAYIFTCSATYPGIFPGANASLRKPLQPKALEQLVSSYLNSEWYKKPSISISIQKGFFSSALKGLANRILSPKSSPKTPETPADSLESSSSSSP